MKFSGQQAKEGRMEMSERNFGTKLFPTPFLAVRLLRQRIRVKNAAVKTRTFKVGYSAERRTKAPVLKYLLKKVLIGRL